jgi:hypothetical protein
MSRISTENIYDRITGIGDLIKGIKYIEVAKSYFGVILYKYTV